MTIPCRTHRRLAVPALAIMAGILGTSMIPVSSRATEPAPIAWRDDYGGAIEEARATNRLVWIQFTGPWCPNCVRMERDSFPDADIIEHSQRSYVPLKLRSDVHERLALGFNVSGLPATVLVAPTREIVAIRQGYLGPDELDQFLSESLATWRGRTAGEKSSVAETGPETEDEDDRRKEAEPAAARPKEEPQLALSGYCPVSLIADRKLVRGQAEHTVQHEGRLYRFASAVLSHHFRGDPERYIPANGGNCPVSQVEHGAAKPGDPRWGVLYQGRLFLCASEDGRRQFLREPGRYAMVDVAERGFCPHCLGETGLLVRGDPRCAVTREGRRYWFPHPSHRTAFLASTTSATATATASGPDSTTTRR